MIDKLLTGFLVFIMIAFPTAAAVSGYVVLTDHLQGALAVAYGWVLFLGGFASLPFFGAGIAELIKPATR